MIAANSKIGTSVRPPKATEEEEMPVERAVPVEEVPLPVEEVTVPVEEVTEDIPGGLGLLRRPMYLKPVSAVSFEHTESFAAW